MRFLNALAIALSMYSKIPAPTVDWNDKNMKYAMCFFPVVGVVTGLLQFGAGYVLLTYTSCGKLLFAAVMTLIPVLVTGGIHLDGYADTIDALSSWGNREKKLEILKDPHTGAFAVIGLCVYFTAVLALWSEADAAMLPLAACMYPLSRALSGISVVSFPTAKNSGLLKTFHDEQRAFEDFSRRRPPPAGPGRADPLGLRGCGPDARPWPAAGRRGTCGGRTYDRSGASCVPVLLPDEQETVRRNDRRPGRIFPAGVRAGDAGGGGHWMESVNSFRTHR